MANKECKKRAKLASKLEKGLNKADSTNSVEWLGKAMVRGVVKKSGRQVLTHVVQLEGYSDTSDKFLKVIPIERGRSKQPELGDEALIFESTRWSKNPGVLLDHRHKPMGDYEGPTDANALAILEEATAATPLEVDGRISELLMPLVR